MILQDFNITCVVYMWVVWSESTPWGGLSYPYWEIQSAGVVIWHLIILINKWFCKHFTYLYLQWTPETLLINMKFLIGEISSV